MIKYLSMDLRRLFRTKSFYVSMLIIIIFLSIFATASYYVEGMAEEMLPPGSHAVPSQVLDQVRKLITFNFFFSFFFSIPGMRMHHVLLALFAAGYLSKEHHTGYLKNLFCLPRMREKWMVSKSLTVFIAAIVYYMVFALACVVALMLYGNPMVIHLSEILPFIAGQVLVDMALFSLIMVMVMLLQSKAAAVITALILSLNIQSLLYLLIDWLNVLPFKLIRYGMMNLASKAQIPGSMSSLMNQSGMQFSQGAPVGDNILYLVAGCVFALSLLLSWFLFRRVDYKN
ncbi:MAG: ABC transporter permease subunit [Clostridiales bacterium]|nr:ABC transporter permease subunit [Clostridiales bacterium]